MKEDDAKALEFMKSVKKKIMKRNILIALVCVVLCSAVAIVGYNWVFVKESYVEYQTDLIRVGPVEQDYNFILERDTDIINFYIKGNYSKIGAYFLKNDDGDDTASMYFEITRTIYMDKFEKQASQKEMHVQFYLLDQVNFYREGDVPPHEVEITRFYYIIKDYTNYDCGGIDDNDFLNNSILIWQKTEVD